MSYIHTNPYVCMSTPWSLGRCTRLSDAKAESEFKNGDLSVKEETLTEKHRSSRIAGGLHRVDTPAHEKLFAWKFAKENQGQQRAVKPMVMKNITNFSELVKHISSTTNCIKGFCKECSSAL
jgi:hypothetical protein